MKKYIEIKNLKKYFFSKDNTIKAVDDLSFSIPKGKTLSLVGESGSGKSTVAKLILRLIEKDSGKVFLEGKNIFDISIKDFKGYRKKMQIIFQDPYSSLDPRMNVKEIIEEPLKIHKIDKKNRAKNLIKLVNLPYESLEKFPHEFSGGQRQRIGIARALSLNPNFLVLDEPVSALDVSIQAQIINLLKDLQKKLKLTYLFISHDLALVKYVSDLIAVIYHGKIMEYGESKKIFASPKHPYTKMLLDSVLALEFGAEKIRKRKIKNIECKSGCVFYSRCKKRKKMCFERSPKMQKLENNHFIFCHFF